MQIRRRLHITPVFSERCPAEVLERQTSVPYSSHVGEPVAVEPHDINVICDDLSTRGRNRPTLPGMHLCDNCATKAFDRAAIASRQNNLAFYTQPVIASRY